MDEGGIHLEWEACAADSESQFLLHHSADELQALLTSVASDYNPQIQAKVHSDYKWAIEWFFFGS